MTRTTIAHFINPFLPITQNWMYHQLRFNTECRHIVLCQTLENTACFLASRPFRVQKKQSFRAGEHGPCARPRAVFYRVLSSGHQTGKAAGMHGHFSWESWRNFGLIKKTGLPLVTTFYGLDVNKLARLPQWQRRYPMLFRRGRFLLLKARTWRRRLRAIGMSGKKNPRRADRGRHRKNISGRG